MRFPKGTSITTLRPAIFKREAGGVTFYNAVVRGAEAKRTYLGTTTDKAQALAICERFIATGERPPKAKTGPKGARSGKPARPRKPRSITLNPVKPTPKPKPQPKPQDTNNHAPKMSHQDKIAMLRGMLARIG